MTYELSFVFLLEQGQKGAAELCGNWTSSFLGKYFKLL